jgi:PKD repeat protein
MRSRLALILVTFAVLTIMGSVSGGTTNPDDPARKLGGEMLIYQMDDDDHNNPSQDKTFDRSGNGNHGTLVTGSGSSLPELVSAKFEKGYKFGSDDPHLEAPELDYDSTHTLVIWFKINRFQGGTNRPQVLSWRDDLCSWQIRGEDNYVDVRASKNGSISYEQMQLIGSEVKKNVWYHAGIRLDGSSATIYLNGTQVNSGTFDCVDKNNQNELGFEPDERTTVDEFRVYDRVLSSSEISSISNEPYNESVTADFSFSKDGLQVDYLDQSNANSGTIRSRNWSFGDGSGNHGNNATTPGHTYSSSGTYTVQLWVETTEGDNDTATETITVSDDTDADFSFSKNGLKLSFQDKSNTTNGAIRSRNWSFGDGFGNHGNNATKPSHNYTSSGTFEVKLWVETTQNGNDTATKNITISRIIFEGSTEGFKWLEDMGGTWQDQKVWVRDAGGGKAYRLTKDLTKEIEVNLCSESDLQNGNTTDGLAVSQDDPSRPVWICEETGGNTHFLMKLDSNGNAVSRLNAYDTTESPSPTAIDAISLNNVSWAGTGQDVSYFGLSDLANLEEKWEKEIKPGSTAHWDDVAVEHNTSRSYRVCFTGDTASTTRCYSNSGSLSARNDAVEGDQIEVLDGRTFLRSFKTVERLGSNLEKEEQIFFENDPSSIALSQDGEFLATANRTGSNSGDWNLTLHHASNLTHIASSTGGNMKHLGQLTWGSKGKLVYGRNRTHVGVWNVTGVLNASTESRTETTTEQGEDRPEDGPTPGDSVLIPNLAASSEALGVSEGTALVFYSLLLASTLMLVGAVSVGQATQSGFGSVIGGISLFFVGIVLSNAFGWLPGWVVLLVFMGLAAIVVVYVRSGGIR